MAITVCEIKYSNQPLSSVKKEYDFSKPKKNPYVKGLKKQVTIRLDAATIEARSRRIVQTI